MKSEHLLDAIGKLDDDLVVEAEEKPARRKLPLWQVATVAAAAFVVCGGLYLLPAMQPAGTAAPESQGTGNNLFDDVADTAGGILTDGAFDSEYEYKTDQSAVRAPSTANKETAGETQAGVVEPVFCTEQGRYMLVGEELPIKSKLPEDVRYLGELAMTEYSKQVYPSVGTEELVGCAVWQSVDGEYLYIQTSAGQWLQATRSK